MAQHRCQCHTEHISKEKDKSQLYVNSKSIKYKVVYFTLEKRNERKEEKQEKALTVGS
jgi:hypothetical protein